MFKPVTDKGALFACLLGVLVASGILFFILSLLPPRARKPLIIAITFISGLFFALEFFLPVVTVKTGSLEAGQNFLSPYVKPISEASTVLQAFALGLGVYSLFTVHMRNIARQRSGWGYSVVLLLSIFAMAVPGIGKEYLPKGPNNYWQTAYNFFYDGGYNKLDQAMFSIIAFYIASAAYRAFRLRSTEASILLISAFIVMLGNVALGQALTNWIPNDGFMRNFHIERISDWILTKVNSPAIRAISFGLGIGGLATSLRLWLSLERGSYFDKEL